MLQNAVKEIEDLDLQQLSNNEHPYVPRGFRKPSFSDVQSQDDIYLHAQYQPLPLILRSQAQQARFSSFRTRKGEHPLRAAD